MKKYQRGIDGMRPERSAQFKLQMLSPQDREQLSNRQMAGLARSTFYRQYFTGMRTGEAHGLKWKYIDFERRLILVREAIVLKEKDELKTNGSVRDIRMRTLSMRCTARKPPPRACRSFDFQAADLLPKTLDLAVVKLVLADLSAAPSFPWCACAACSWAATSGSVVRQLVVEAQEELPDA